MSGTSPSFRGSSPEVTAPDQHLSLRARVRAHVARRLPVGTVIRTVAERKPNTVAAVDDEGVWLETGRTIEKGTGPQLVPWWMFEKAWAHLEQHGRLTNKHLLDELNVKRSAAVCAVLATLPEIRVVATRPITLELRKQSRLRRLLRRR